MNDIANKLNKWVNQMDSKLTQKELDKLKESDTAFWCWHPFGRAIASGVASFVFTQTTSFKTGFVYGGISGLTNLAIHPVAKTICNNTDSTHIKSLTYMSVQTLPWICSYYATQKLNVLYPNSLFAVNHRVATGLTIAGAIFGYANSDLMVKNSYWTWVENK